MFLFPKICLLLQDSFRFLVSDGDFTSRRQNFQIRIENTKKNVIHVVTNPMRVNEGEKVWIYNIAENNDFMIKSFALFYLKAHYISFLCNQDHELELELGLFAIINILTPPPKKKVWVLINDNKMIPKIEVENNKIVEEGNSNKRLKT